MIDTAGNISSVETKVNDIVTDTVEYTYGNAYWSDRLTAVTIDNAVNNPVTKNISYTSAGGYCNPVSWFNGTEYTNLTWTQGRRLSSITEGSDTYSYEYDMSGIRSAKVANGLRHEYVTQDGRVARETVYALDSNTGEYTVFQYALDFTYDEAGHPLTMRRYNNADMEHEYITMHYVCNAQGDVVKLIYQYNGNLITYAEYIYDAWGNVIAESGSSGYETLNPLRYRGYYYDTETGFYYLQSRYYDPIVKRFLNADSYGSTGQGFIGYNMFAYCNNNPILSADPTGESLLGVLLGIGVGLALLFSGCDSDSENTEYARKANCYAFAFMMSKDPRTGKAFNHLPQPGEFSGRTYSEKIIEKKSQGEEVSYAQIKSIIVDSVKADGTVLHFSIEEVGSADYPTKDGQWLVALAYDRDSYNYDYHWWRRMSDGTWSHKPGTSSISSVDSNKNTILDPGNCNRGKYETFFGYFLVTPTD